MIRFFTLRFFIFIGLAFTSTWSVAQVSLPVKGGELLLAVFEEETYTWNQETGDTHDHFIRAVAFSTSPNPILVKRWEATGIEWLGYWGNGIFELAFPQDITIESLALADVTHVGIIPSALRFAPNIVTQDIPDHAWQGDSIVLYARFQPFISPSQIRKEIEAMGFQANAIAEESRNRVFEIILLPENWERLTNLPALHWVEFAPPPPAPESSIGIGQHRALLRLPSGDDLDGSGIGIAIRETPFVQDHIDYRGRFDNTFAGTGGGTHGNFTSGVAAGAGNLSPGLKGMASGADVYALDYRPDFLGPTLPLHEGGNILITNSSYGDGCNLGYTLLTELVDQQMERFPSLLHIFSAGNSGGTNCGYGAGGTYGNITGGHKTGKNVLAVGSVNAADNLSGFSSRGPSQDGRIKPDLVALGQSVLLTGTSDDQGSASGTSFSAPAVAGVAAQLYQGYKELHAGQLPEAALIKALLLNGAKDLGTAGPDYQYGWGRLDGKAAWEALENQWYLFDSVSQNQVQTHQISLPLSASGVKLMVYWTDPAAHPMALTALVHDLDMQVVHAGDTLLPLTLNPTPDISLLSAPAQAGRDSLNNVEQVVLQQLTGNTLEVIINGTDIGIGPQAYWVVYQPLFDSIRWDYPVEEESITPNEPTWIRWNSRQDSLPFSLAYRLSPAQSWELISDSIFSQGFNWTTPDTFSASLQFRLVQGTHSQVSPEVSLLGSPAGLIVEQICPEVTRISWSPVKGADRFQVFRLGNRYMDSLSVAADTFYLDSTAQEMEEPWYSVRALGPGNLQGQRAFAVQKGAGRFNCPIEGDIGAAGGTLRNATSGLVCFQDSASLILSLRNEGTQAVEDVPFQFRILPSGAWNYDTLQGPIAGNSTSQQNVRLPLGAFSGDSIPLELVTNYTGDAYALNDTLRLKLPFVPSQIEALPYVQDFEGWKVCNYFPDCEATECLLAEGWTNAPNGLEDDIDWRLHSGKSLLLGTGPTEDRLPGNLEGHYLYLETGGNCRNKEAYLVSPCMDLRAVTQPELRFGYHLFGAGIVGFISVDIWSEGRWIRNVVPNLAGNKGDQWLEQVVSLDAFSGQIIRIRIRGRTGNSTLGHIAIDDFRVRDRVSPTTVAFSARPTWTCTQNQVLLTALPSPQADSIQWFSFPNGITFLAGTNKHSDTAFVSFEQAGNYGIGLIVIDSLGRDTLFTPEAIKILPGLTSDWSEDFDSGYFPPEDWLLLNPDRDLNWQWREVIGPDGTLSRAAVMHHSLLLQGGLDAMILPPIDLRGGQSPMLVFDVSYARDTARIADDILRIKVSEDCGNSFPHVLYNKAGSTLSTFPDIDEFWNPTQAYHWRRDTVTLSPFSGSEISLQIETLFGGSNPIYLDNIQLLDTGASGPIARIEIEQGGLCASDSFVLAARFPQPNVSYVWNLGGPTLPLSISGPGPHVLRYTQAGLYNIELLAIQNGDTSVTNQVVEFIGPPDASFEADVLDSVFRYRFTPTGREPFTTYTWNLGDGGSSEEAVVAHMYTDTGSYSVQLITSNACGVDSFTQQIQIGSTQLTSFDPSSWQLIPNPAHDRVMLSGPSGRFIQALTLFTLQGQKVTLPINPLSRNKWELDISSLSKGLYLLEGWDGERKVRIKLLKE